MEPLLTVIWRYMLITLKI